MKLIWRKILIGIVVYVTVYLALSRISARMNSRIGIQGFFYVPVNATRMRSATWSFIQCGSLTAGSSVAQPFRQFLCSHWTGQRRTGSLNEIP